MDFQLSDDQRALRTGIRELLAGRFGRDRMRAALDAGTDVDRVVWGELGAAGFFALRLPEAEGGVGLGLPESVLLFEEAGRVLLPGPLAVSHLAAGAVKGAAEGGTVVAVLDEGRPVAHLGAADALIALVGGEVRVLEGAALREFVRGARPVRSLDPFTPLHRVTTPAALGDPCPGPRRRGSGGKAFCWPPPSSSAAPHAPPRRLFNTPVGASSSARRSVPSRRSNTCAPRCWYAPSWPAPRCTRRP